MSGEVIAPDGRHAYCTVAVTSSLLCEPSWIEKHNFLVQDSLRAARHCGHLPATAGLRLRVAETRLILVLPGVGAEYCSALPGDERAVSAAGRRCATSRSRRRPPRPAACCPTGSGCVLQDENCMHPNMPCTFLYDIALSCSLEKCNCMAPMACWGGPDTFRRKHCTELGSVTELALHFAEQGVSGLAVPNYETSLVSEGGAYFCGTGEEQRGLRQPGAPGGLCGASSWARRPRTCSCRRCSCWRPPTATLRRARGGRRCAFKPPAVRLIWLPVPQHHQCCRTPCGARARVRTAVRGVPCHAPDPAVWGATPPVLPAACNSTHNACL